MLIRAKQLVEECDALLVVGSSLMVYSAFRLARAAATSGAQLALLSVGPTRADDIADIKVRDAAWAAACWGGFWTPGSVPLCCMPRAATLVPIAQKASKQAS